MNLNQRENNPHTDASAEGSGGNEETEDDRAKLLL